MLVKLEAATCGGEETEPSEDAAGQGNFPAEGAEWVELLVREMISATSVDDARGRATRVLENLEKSINSRVGAEAAESFHKVWNDF